LGASGIAGESGEEKDGGGCQGGGLHVIASTTVYQQAPPWASTVVHGGRPPGSSGKNVTRSTTHPQRLDQLRHDPKRLLGLAQPPPARDQWPIKYRAAHPGSAPLRWITSSQKCPCNARQARHGVAPTFRGTLAQLPATGREEPGKPGAAAERTALWHRLWAYP